MRRLGPCMGISVLVCLAPWCFAQTVTIRVINGKNGHPLSGQGVAISLLYDGSEKAPADYVAQLSLKTDDNGEAHFRLPEPPPAHIAASVRIDWSRWRCPCNLLDSTRDVVQLGVVRAEGSNKGLSKPRPCEILFVARPLSLIYRLLGPIEKD